jgi:peptide-methionine (S)-S-oxide reductase
MITHRARIASTVLVPLAVLACTLPGVARQAEQARVLPPPVHDEPAGAATSETAVFAGGCFWGVQGVFQHVKGVTGAVSGYAGGDKRTAKYEEVGSGRTGHAEAVQVTYDPRVITYGRLLQILFSVAHDPTQLDRQGPDVGPQYRSAIFPNGDGQAGVAKAYIDQLMQARVFPSPIVTRIEPGASFYAAEPYHQDFLTRHPDHPYIVFNDLPKLKDLQKIFPDLYRAQPVLVGAKGSKR